MATLLASDITGHICKVSTITQVGTYVVQNTSMQYNQALTTGNTQSFWTGTHQALTAAPLLHISFFSQLGVGAYGGSSYFHLGMFYGSTWLSSVRQHLDGPYVKMHDVTMFTKYNASSLSAGQGFTVDLRGCLQGIFSTGSGMTGKRVGIGTSYFDQNHGHSCHIVIAEEAT